MNQLSSFARGSHTQSWSPDALGNFNSVTTDGNAQTRTHNKQNQITSVSGATTPTYDSNGNLTKDETGKQFVYDAWNRLVTVKNSGGTVLETFAYDALFRRVSVTASGTTTDLYYSAAWQVLEERVGSSVKIQYVWSPVYVDAMVLRDRDADGNAGNGLEQRLWVQQDANFNVTALLDSTGAVVERYAYDPFGKVTIYDANWNVRSSSSYAWVHFHQGLRYDATATLYDNRRRPFSPTQMRFTSNDPIGFPAGDQNLYRYVGNGPTGALDPSGLDELAPNFALDAWERELYLRLLLELLREKEVFGDPYSKEALNNIAKYLEFLSKAPVLTWWDLIRAAERLGVRMPERPFDRAVFEMAAKRFGIERPRRTEANGPTMEKRSQKECYKDQVRLATERMLEARRRFEAAPYPHNREAYEEALLELQRLRAAPPVPEPEPGEHRAERPPSEETDQEIKEVWERVEREIGDPTVWRFINGGPSRTRSPGTGRIPIDIIDNRYKGRGRR